MFPVDVTIEEVEPAHMLANDARGLLRAAGFDDDDIDGWAREYVALGGVGAPADLVAWIRSQERRHAGRS
jgi:phosphoserine phosphatase